MPAEICQNNQIPLQSQSTKATLPTPVLIAHTTANHPATAHCGLTLIGDQKQTIIQAYTRAGKIAKASHTVNSDLMRPQTPTAVKASTQPPPQPCGFDTQVRVTHPLLDQSLGCLAEQVLTASPLNFARSHWLEHGLRPCSSENLAATF